MAWWSGAGGPADRAYAAQWLDTKALPSGGVVLTQYSAASDPTGRNPFDADYAC
jgi:hypothetical protein